MKKQTSPVKTFLKLIMALMMLFSFGCQSNNDDSPYAFREIKVSDKTEGFKILGVRHLESDEGINIDYSCSGVEFKADCEGTMTLHLHSNAPCYFRFYIDGKPYEKNGKEKFTVDGNMLINLVDIEKGVHEFKIIKISGYTIALTELTQIDLHGTILEERPADRNLYIEFIGDSLTCGWGLYPDEEGLYSSSYISQDGTKAYAYLTAEALKADYSLFAFSGRGLITGDITIKDSYDYASIWRDNQAKYDFARKADITVINIGTNDYKEKATTSTTFKAEYIDLIRRIREKNGENCLIIMTYNMKNDTFVTYLKAIAKEFNIPLLKFDRSTNEEAFRHPSLEEQAAAAEKLISFIDDCYGE